MADDGVFSFPIARPTIGESFVISIKAPVLGLDFETPFPESSIFLDIGKLLERLELVEEIRACDLVILLVVDDGVSIDDS